MATFTAGPDQRFKPGTVLNVYPSVAGKPSAAAASTATVAADSTTTWTGLAENVRYLAGVTPNGPFIAFRIEAPPEEEGSGVSVSMLETALNVVQQDEDGEWPDRPTMDDETIPWPLTWVSQPGNVTTPLAKMAELDVYIPVPEP